MYEESVQLLQFWCNEETIPQATIVFPLCCIYEKLNVNKTHLAIFSYYFFLTTLHSPEINIHRLSGNKRNRKKLELHKKII